MALIGGMQPQMLPMLRVKTGTHGPLHCQARAFGKSPRIVRRKDAESVYPKHNLHERRGFGAGQDHINVRRKAENMATTRSCGQDLAGIRSILYIWGTTCPELSSTFVRCTQSAEWSDVVYATLYNLNSHDDRPNSAAISIKKEQTDRTKVKDFNSPPAQSRHS